MKTNDKMQFQREILLIGEEAFEKLNKSHILLFGLGGVGGFCAEALIRAGIGELTIVDFDTVDITNLNRQIIATHKSIGKYKVDLIEERAREINPNIKINKFAIKYEDKNKNLIFPNNYDYIVDAIDIVSSKLSLIIEADKYNIPIISSMGTGNKLKPELLEITDIYKTSVCPLARVMRKELKERKIKKLKVIYSKEEPKKPKNDENSREKSKNVGSISFVPSTAGLLIASQVIRDLIN